MMRTLRTVAVLAILVNVLAAAVFVGWLYTSGRVSAERLHKAVVLFKPTVAQEKQQTEQEHSRQQQEAATQADSAWADRVAGGPVNPLEQLTKDENSRRAAQLQQERLARERGDVLRQFKLAMDHLAQEREALDKDRAAFEEARGAEVKRRDDPDFQKALELYEQLKPRQVKGAFQELLQKNQSGQVIEYLAAMQPRKAVAVLSEFKTPEEIVQATELIQKVRARGVDTLLARTGASGASGGRPELPSPGAGPGRERSLP